MCVAGGSLSLQHWAALTSPQSFLPGLVPIVSKPGDPPPNQTRLKTPTREGKIASKTKQGPRVSQN